MNKNTSENKNSQIKNNHDTPVHEIINYEKNRYMRKGYGFMVAIIIFISWFTIILNIFKLWWPKKIENEGKFYVLACFFTHEISYVIFNSIQFIIYKLEHPFFERYKINDKEWPWKKNSQEWNLLLKDSIKNVLANHFIFLPLILMPYYIQNNSLTRVEYETLPDYKEVLLHTIFFMLMEDTSFYWVHRFLHIDSIYPYIHKIHHKYVNTVSIASEYAHPIEYIFGNIVTTSLGALILGKKAHLLTYLMWMTFRIAETTDGHSGYDFSWSPFRLLPMSAGSEFHNYHHLAFKGNYGSFFTFWDVICNTVHSKYLDFVEKNKDTYKKCNEMEKLKEK